MNSVAKNYFGEMTEKMKKFRMELVEAKPHICVERALITTKVYRENQDQPLAIKRAIMLRSILEGMSIFIEPQSLIAGNQAQQQSQRTHIP